MPKVFESGIVDASADDVWAIFRDFGGVRKIAPPITSCEIEDGKVADQVGAIRRLTLEGGITVREQLVELSDVERRVKLIMLPPEARPIRDYMAEVRVIPITDCGKALIEWTGCFEASETDSAELEQTYHAIYRSGIEGVRAYLKDHGGAS